MGDQEKKAQELSAALTSYVNAFGYDKPALVKAITSEHRTLQQQVMNVMLACMEKWADDYKCGYYDLRNEATCKLAVKIIESIKDDKYLPYI